MADFNSLPFEIHRLIFHDLLPDPRQHPYYHGKLPLRHPQNAQIYQYATLNHTWRILVQQLHWSHLTIPPFEIPALQSMLEKSPGLAGYINTLTIRSRARTPNSDPPRNPDEFTNGLELDLEPDGPDTIEGAKIYKIWQQILDLHKNIRLLSGQRPIDIRFFVSLGKGSEYRFVDLPKSETPLLLDGPYLQRLTFEIPRARRGDQLSIKSVASLFGSVGHGLDDLHLICTDIEESRPYRRELYASLCRMIPLLLSSITPRLTRFTLTYPSFTPFKWSETRIYPLILIDNNIDLLSRALRVLSKQLVSFKYYGGRVSRELFNPPTHQDLEPNELEPNEFEPNEPAIWPNLQVYIVYFAPITPSGEWMFSTNWDPDSMSSGDPWDHVGPMSSGDAWDHQFIDPAFYEDNYYVPYIDPQTPRKQFKRPYRPIYDGAGVCGQRSKPLGSVERLLISASNAMVGRMPKIRYWRVAAHGKPYAGLKFDYTEQGPVPFAPSNIPCKDDYKAEHCINLSTCRGRPRLYFDWDVDYFKTPKEATSPWRKAFRGWKPWMQSMAAMGMPDLKDIDQEELSLEEAGDTDSGIELHCAESWALKYNRVY